MEVPNQIRETTQLKVEETKKKIKELQEYLALQFVEHEKEQEKKKLQKIRNELAKKHHKNRFSSFTNSLHRPQFINQIKEKDLFENQSVFINKDVPQLTNLQKSQLITPDRNQNPSYSINMNDISNTLIGQTNKQIKKRISTYKEEILKLEGNQPHRILGQKLQPIVGNRVEGSMQSIDKPNRKVVCQLEKQRSSLLNKGKQRYFDKNISLISENPITQRSLSRVLSLPKIKEKKVWMPNNNYF